MFLERIDPDGPSDAKDTAAQDTARDQAVLRAAREVVRAVGGFAGQHAGIDRVSAYHGDNHAPLVARHFRNDRAAMLAMVSVLELEATSADRGVLAALGFVREHANRTRDHVADQVVVADQAGVAVRDAAGAPITAPLDVLVRPGGLASRDPGPSPPGDVRAPAPGCLRADLPG